MDLAYLLLDIDNAGGDPSSTDLGVIEDDLTLTPAERLARHLQQLTVNDDLGLPPRPEPDNETLTGVIPDIFPPRSSNSTSVTDCGPPLDDALAAMTQAYLTALLSSVSDPPAPHLAPPPPNVGYRSPNANGRGRPMLPLLPRFDTRSENGGIDCTSPMNMRTMTSKSTGGGYAPSFFGTSATGGQSPGGWGASSTGRASKSGGNMSFQKMQCFKTKQCRFWLDGRCTRGDECTFAHCDGELRDKPDLTKTKICAKWRAGQCPKSPGECTYAHGVEDLRTLQQHPSSSNASRSEMERSPVNRHPVCDTQPQVTIQDTILPVPQDSEDPLLSKLAALTLDDGNERL